MQAKVEFSLCGVYVEFSLADGKSPGGGQKMVQTLAPFVWMGKRLQRPKHLRRRAEQMHGTQRLRTHLVAKPHRFHIDAIGRLRQQLGEGERSWFHETIVGRLRMFVHMRSLIR